MVETINEIDESKIPMERIVDLIDSLQNINTNLQSQVLLLTEKINLTNQQLETTTTELLDVISKTSNTGDICYSLLSSKQGWLLCDGSEYSRIDYANLFAIIGTTFGQGDGSTTFNVPDYRGKFLQMVDSNSSVGDEKEAGLPNITGQWNATGIGLNISGTGCFTGPWYTGGGETYGGNGASNTTHLPFNASHSNSIYGNSSTVQPPASVVNYFIKF